MAELTTLNYKAHFAEIYLFLNASFWPKTYTFVAGNLDFKTKLAP